MSAVIRDTFIALHSSDILGKLDAEFRVRYAKYKIPLSSLSKEYQENLELISKSSSVGESQLQDSAEDSDVEFVQAHGTDNDEPQQQPKSQFVDLVDILPPLPKKGGFDVNTIKKSLYFFS
jgi:DNA-directed RNA polymerase, mitochondrial